MTSGKFATSNAEEPILKVPGFFRYYLNSGKWGRVVAIANALAPAMSAHFGEGKMGGVITLCAEARQVPYLVHTQAEVGTPDPSELSLYYTLSLEKAVRTIRLGDINSWNSGRDLGLYQGGGAFKIMPYGLHFSFEGWTEQDNIVFLAYTLYRAELLSERDVQQIFRTHAGITLELMERWEQFVDTFEAVPV